MGLFTIYCNYKKGLFNNLAGVYIIFNKINHKIYIGGTKNIADRLGDHISSLIKNNHHNHYLQRAINKYGIDNFIFDIIEICEPDIVYNREGFWTRILKASSEEEGYVLKIEDEVENKRVISKETKDKISKAFRKPIIILNKDNTIYGKFESTKQASILLTLTEGKISHALNNNHYYKDKIFLFEKDYNPEKFYKFEKKKVGGSGKRKIAMYSLDNRKMCSFSSITEAAQLIGGTTHGLFKAVKGIRDTYYKKIWKYEN